MNRSFASIAFLFGCFFCLSLAAQSVEGSVSFEKKINLWKRIKDESRRAMVPEFRTSKNILYYNDSVSLSKVVPEEEDGMSAEGEGGGRPRFGRMMGGMEGDLYKNYNSGLLLQALEVAGKDFLIVDTVKKMPWKISTETKEILGQICHKAVSKQKNLPGMEGGWGRSRSETSDTATEKEIVTIAWFAPSLKVPIGPDQLGQLPGPILEADVDDGFIVYKATALGKGPVAKELKEPKKGKRTTKAEFRKMMQEMMRNFGGGGGMPPLPGH